MLSSFVGFAACLFTNFLPAPVGGPVPAAKSSFQVQVLNPGTQYVNVPFQASAYVTTTAGIVQWQLIGEWIAGARINGESVPALLDPLRIPLAPDTVVVTSTTYIRTDKFTCTQQGKTALAYTAQVPFVDTVQANSGIFECIAPNSDIPPPPQQSEVQPPVPQQPEVQPPSPQPLVPVVPRACLPQPLLFDPPSGKTLTQNVANFEWRSTYALQPGESFVVVLSDNRAGPPTGSIIPDFMIFRRTSDKRAPITFDRTGLTYWSVAIVDEKNVRLDCGGTTNALILQGAPPRPPTRPPEKPPTPKG